MRVLLGLIRIDDAGVTAVVEAVNTVACFAVGVLVAPGAGLAQPKERNLKRDCPRL